MRACTYRNDFISYIYIYICNCYFTFGTFAYSHGSHVQHKGSIQNQESRKGKQNGRYGQESEQKVNFLILSTKLGREQVMTKQKQVFFDLCHFRMEKKILFLCQNAVCHCLRLLIFYGPEKGSRIINLEAMLIDSWLTFVYPLFFLLYPSFSSAFCLSIPIKRSPISPK